MNKRDVLIKICQVIDVYDETDGERIKVRLSPEDDRKSDDKIPYAFPLLPKLLHIKPKVGEFVLVILTEAGNGYSNRYYIGPIISQPQFMEKEDFLINAMSLYPGSYKGPDIAPSTNADSHGALVENDDIAIYGRKKNDIILTNNEELITKINKAVFPGIQGGPLENIIAAKAVCFYEALQPEFKNYMNRVVKNCDTLASCLKTYGFNVLTGGTDNHLILLDLRNKNITGAELEKRLEEVHVVTNKNAVPFDTENKKTTSGLRLGTAAVTSRGLQNEDMFSIASIINVCADNKETYEANKEILKNIVRDICDKYPLYKED